MVEDRGTAVVGFEAYLNGVVSGKIVDQDGQGYNSAFLHLVEKSIEKGRSVYGHSTGEDGSFEVFGVPPGEYILYLELQGSDYKKNKLFYFPGTIEREEAEGIKVGLGGKVEGLEFFLPKEFKIRTIEGQVLWEDGKPAVNVKVMLLCPGSAKADGFTIEFHPTETRTDENGHFELEGFTGEFYWLESRASKKVDSHSGKSIEVPSPSRKIALTDNLKNLRLILSEKGLSNSCGK